MSASRSESSPILKDLLFWAHNQGLHLKFSPVTENGARALGLEGYGLAPGCKADLVVLQAIDEIEALRLRHHLM